MSSTALLTRLDSTTMRQCIRIMRTRICHTRKRSSCRGPGSDATHRVAHSLMGKAMNSEYCLMSAPSFLSSAYSAASSFRCSVTRVPRGNCSASVSSRICGAAAYGMSPSVASAGCTTAVPAHTPRARMHADDHNL